MNDGELTSRRATKAFIVADSEGKDRWITNSASLAESLEQARPSDKTEMVAAVLNGIKGQVIPTRKFGEGYNVDTETNEMLAEPDYEDELQETFWDDISGSQLPARAVYEARMKELEFLRRCPVYRKVPIEQSHGKAVLDTR